LKRLLLIFNGHYERFREVGFSGLAVMISQKLYKPEGVVEVIQGNENFRGKISGITDQGTILIETPEKMVEVV
jgi:biotin-(acetyl-CoA carboxylase) ligase